MLLQRVKSNPLTDYVEKVKTAVKGNTAARDIKEAVSELLKSYGIEVPEKK
jgi:hypothetical protein